MIVHFVEQMKIFISKHQEVDHPCEALILPFLEKCPDSYSDSLAPLSPVVSRLYMKGFRGKKNECLLVPSPFGMKPERILFVGLGPREDLSPETFRQAGGRSAVFLREAGLKTTALSTRLFDTGKISPVSFVEGYLLGSYRFEKYRKSGQNTNPEQLAVLAKKTDELQRRLAWTQCVCESVAFARDLVNTPANDMTPSHLADTARSLRGKLLTTKVLEAKRCEKLGMGAFLSVARGSHEPAKFIVIEYRGAKNRPIVLIGKSITFDSGGISLKPAEGMEKMKYDMAGGAAVLGVIRALAEKRYPVNVIGILPATENLPGGSASRPGDVVRAITGKTIEIVSTDAEGRMTLADAIGYAQRYRPRAIIDIATLTGACAVAFGNTAIAMMGNDRRLLDALKAAGEQTSERVWEMPLFKECGESLTSDVADLKNTGGKGGSLLSSAYFLSEFAGRTPWVHLDIAGTAWADKESPYMPKGATGVGVRLLLAFLVETYKQ